MVKKAHSKEQSPLFAVEGTQQSPSYLPWQELEVSPAAQVRAVQSEYVGPHVVIAERAERLVRTMNALAHRNMLQGFDVGANDHRYSPPIYERYLDATPRVLDASRSKVDKLHEEAADNFWHAMGFEALRGSGLITRGEMRTRSSKMWRDFQDQYGSPKQHKPMNKFRNKQKKTLPIDHELRRKKKRGAEVLERAA